ncbi:hypothetical protein CU661_14140 [Pseudomonas syringae pv. actinidifoliorum]|nr:hypothetical protein [Pseudomonas syringae pv. actinidifoliorum]NAT38382.1 hypothetical protein [Pseudomonas syringae pv. actinidifoliorum]
MISMNDQAIDHKRRLPPAGRGRAQDKSRDGLIIKAALELLLERGYHQLTMTDVAARAGVSKATLYRRWTAKADLVTDAFETLDLLSPPAYPGTSLREDLLALMKEVSRCDDRPQIVTSTMEMARLQPDLHQSLTERFSTFLQTELGKLARHTADTRHAPLTENELKVMGDAVVALLAYYAGPSGSPISREQLIGIVDHVLVVLMTGASIAGQKV